MNCQRRNCAYCQYPCQGYGAGHFSNEKFDNDLKLPSDHQYRFDSYEPLNPWISKVKPVTTINTTYERS